MKIHNMVSGSIQLEETKLWRNGGQTIMYFHCRTMLYYRISSPYLLPAYIFTHHDYQSMTSVQYWHIPWQLSRASLHLTSPHMSTHRLPLWSLQTSHFVLWISPMIPTTVCAVDFSQDTYSCVLAKHRGYLQLFFVDITCWYYLGYFQLCCVHFTQDTSNWGSLLFPRTPPTVFSQYYKGYL